MKRSMACVETLQNFDVPSGGPAVMSAEQTTKVSYADPGEAAAAFQRSRTCTLSVADLVSQLRKAIEASGLWVLQEIDPQSLLHRGGYAIGAARQILFFHPRLMARVLAADPAALLEAPLKFAILELPGGAVTVRWIDPAAAFARYDRQALADLGQELAETCTEIVMAAIGPNTTAAVNPSATHPSPGAGRQTARMGSQPLKDECPGATTAMARLVSALGEEPIFRPGDHIRVLTRSPVGHYRVPTSLRGRTGWVEAVIEPPAIDNEQEAYGRNAGSKLHYYRIAIPMAEIWPNYVGSPRDGLRIEVFETWLEKI